MDTISNELRTTILALAQISDRLKRLEASTASDKSEIINAIDDAVGTIDLTNIESNVTETNEHVGSAPVGSDKPTVFAYLNALLESIEGQQGGGDPEELPEGLSDRIGLLLNFFGITVAIDYIPMPANDIVDILEDTWKGIFGENPPQLLVDKTGTLTEGTDDINLGNIDLSVVKVNEIGYRLLLDANRNCNVTFIATCTVETEEGGETVETSELVAASISNMELSTIYTLGVTIEALLQAQVAEGTITSVNTLSVVITPKTTGEAGSVHFRIYVPERVE